MVKGRKPALSAEDADHLREMHADPALRETRVTLAHLFRVSLPTVDAVLNRRPPYDKTKGTDPMSAPASISSALVHYEISFVWNNGGGDDNAFTTGVLLPAQFREPFTAAVEAALGGHVSDVTLTDPSTVQPVRLSDIHEIMAAALDGDGVVETQDAASVTDLFQRLAQDVHAHAGQTARYEMSWVVENDEGDNELHRLFVDLSEAQAERLQSFLMDNAPEAWSDVQVFQSTPVTQCAREAAAEIIDAAGAYMDLAQARSLWSVACHAEQEPVWLPDVPHADNPVRNAEEYWAVDVVEDGNEREAFVTADEDAAHVRFREMDAPAGCDVVLVHVTGPDGEIELDRRRVPEILPQP